MVGEQSMVPYCQGMPDKTYLDTPARPWHTSLRGVIGKAKSDPDAKDENALLNELKAAVLVRDQAEEEVLEIMRALRGCPTRVQRPQVGRVMPWREIAAGLGVPDRQTVWERYHHLLPVETAQHRGAANRRRWSPKPGEVGEREATLE